MKVGARTLITFKSAAEWRRTRENQTAETTVSCLNPENEEPGGKISGREAEKSSTD